MLKRVLPFILTLIVGLTLGTFAHRFSPAAPPANEALNKTHTHFCHRSNAFLYRERYVDDSAPLRILSQPEPSYTEAARRDHITGVVRLHVMFGADGEISDVEVVRGLPDGLTEEAVRAAQSIEFTPAMVNGEYIDTARTIEYNFDMY
jgi:TonB family protein